MKKKYAFLIICVICIIGCNKSSQQIDTDEGLIATIKSLSSFSMDNLESYCIDRTILRNPYDFVGDISSESIKEFYNIVFDNKEKGLELSGVLTDLIKSNLPEEYTDFTGYKLSEPEKEIFYLINKSVYENNLESLRLRISCIEDAISKGPSIQSDSKMRLLVYCAAMKGLICTVNEIECSTKSETWEECFKKKLKAMGYVESILCVVEWPLCLGAKAADCLIETKF